MSKSFFSSNLLFLNHLETIKKFKKIFLIQIICLHAVISSSTSSCRTASTDIPWPSLRSSGLNPVSSQSCCMKIRAGCPAFARPCEGVHGRTLLISSSLLFQQCPACLIRLIWIVFVMGGKWPYSYCFVGCCLQDYFKIARSILV